MSLGFWLRHDDFHRLAILGAERKQVVFGEYLLGSIFGKKTGGQRLVRADRPHVVDDPETRLNDISKLWLRFFDLPYVHDDIYKRSIIVVHWHRQPG